MKTKKRSSKRRHRRKDMMGFPSPVWPQETKLDFRNQRNCDMSAVHALHGLFHSKGHVNNGEVAYIYDGLQV